MTKRHLTLLAGLLATAATFGMPAASYADHSQQGFTDGYTVADREREHNFPSRVLVPATPAQLAQLKEFERQLSISDGSTEADWEKRQSPELQSMMAKMANDPKIEALLNFYEAQRRALDGRG